MHLLAPYFYRRCACCLLSSCKGPMACPYLPRHVSESSEHSTTLSTVQAGCWLTRSFSATSSFSARKDPVHVFYARYVCKTAYLNLHGSFVNLQMHSCPFLCRRSARTQCSSCWRSRDGRHVSCSQCSTADRCRRSVCSPICTAPSSWPGTAADGRSRAAQPPHGAPGRSTATWTGGYSSSSRVGTRKGFQHSGSEFLCIKHIL